MLALGSAGTILETLDVGQGFVPTTVEVAPSRAERIYVTGFLADSALVLRSDDRGRNWHTFRVQAYGALPLYISGIDPGDPDRVYARVDDELPASFTSTGSSTAPADHLLVSTDGGETWTTILSPNADLLGFAISPDGSRRALCRRALCRRAPCQTKQRAVMAARSKHNGPRGARPGSAG